MPESIMVLAIKRGQNSKPNKKEIIKVKKAPLSIPYLIPNDFTSTILETSSSMSNLSSTEFVFLVSGFATTALKKLYAVLIFEPPGTSPSN